MERGQNSALKYELTEAAIKDIEGILEHSISEFGITRAEQYFASLKQCIELLSENPKMGLSAKDVLSDYFRFPHENHVIFYKPQKSSSGILIVRILHERMDTTQHLDK